MQFVGVNPLDGMHKHKLSLATSLWGLEKNGSRLGVVSYSIDLPGRGAT